MNGPNLNLLVFTAIAFIGGLVVAIATQILWTRHRKKHRPGVPVEPPHDPSPF